MRTGVFAATLGLMAGCNIFTIEDDIELGQQLRDEINADPETYPVVDRAAAPEAYAHLDRMLDAVLVSDEVAYRDEFAWEIYLIDDDEVLNAFAAPGGYIWMYTGLMRFLEREDDVVGVLGHEVAHAAERHSTNQLSKQYGVSVLLGVIFGSEPGLIPEIAASLTFLSFSRADEKDADDFSVKYLCQSDYAANGAATFFQRILEDQSIAIPEFISTHPSSETRVADINALSDELGCDNSASATAPPWADVLDSLP
ncbi:MAG: M48 family metalloprotease [Myxococcales bacterium]|nr:M48 family metalloprotease [Myxococcales bacterium]